MKTANFEVLEVWKVECPYCFHEQEAPFNEADPMQPMKIECESSVCAEKFILTYERES